MSKGNAENSHPTLFSMLRRGGRSVCHVDDRASCAQFHFLAACPKGRAANVSLRRSQRGPSAHGRGANAANFHTQLGPSGTPLKKCRLLRLLGTR